MKAAPKAVEKPVSKPAPKVIKQETVVQPVYKPKQVSTVKKPSAKPPKKDLSVTDPKVRLMPKPVILQPKHIVKVVKPFKDSKPVKAPVTLDPKAVKPFKDTKPLKAPVKNLPVVNTGALPTKTLSNKGNIPLAKSSRILTPNMLRNSTQLTKEQRREIIMAGQEAGSILNGELFLKTTCNEPFITPFSVVTKAWDKRDQDARAKQAINDIKKTGKLSPSISALLGKTVNDIITKQKKSYKEALKLAQEKVFGSQAPAVYNAVHGINQGKCPSGTVKNLDNQCVAPKNPGNPGRGIKGMLLYIFLTLSVDMSKNLDFFNKRRQSTRSLFNSSTTT